MADEHRKDDRDISTAECHEPAPPHIDQAASTDERNHPDTAPTETGGFHFKMPSIVLAPRNSDGGGASSKMQAQSLKAQTLQQTSDKNPKEVAKRQQLSAPLKDVPLSYIEPPWSGQCTAAYSFDILKSGKIIDSLDLTSKSFYVFGRLKSCDVPMDHPSLSRYHAIVQYCSQKQPNREIGWYLYDLGSTHGSFVNKRKVQARIYVRLRVGYMIKFGGSSRLHLLQVWCNVKSR